MHELVMASANPDKAEEIRAILDAAMPGVVVRPRPTEVPDVIEDADTLEGNARLKAVALAAATGLPAVADDTGLEVDAIGGAPGVRSARFAGENATYDDNVTALLAALVHVAPPDRTARFRTVAMVRCPDGREVVVDGVCEGSISTKRCGEGGFGYDPIFVADEAEGRTFAELDPNDKHAISHRGRAFRALALALAAADEATS